MHPKEKGYIRLTPYMMKHQSYKALSNNAKALYNYMRLWAKGRPTIKYAASLALSFGMDARTFRRARDELVQQGFLEYLNPHCAEKKQTGVYQFSCRWWTGKQPELHDFE